MVVAGPKEPGHNSLEGAVVLPCRSARDNHQKWELWEDTMVPVVLPVDLEEQLAVAACLQS
jgi:hypothetical protein